MASPRSRVATSSRQRAASRSPGENRWTRSRPELFAANIAASASLSSWCGSRTSGRDTATPMLAVSGTEMPDGRERQAERRLQPEGQRGGLRGVAVAGEDEELVGAQPADGVPGPQLLGQPRTDLVQQRVADLVTQRVVDGLEAVDVDHQQRRARAVGRRGPRAARVSSSRVDAVGQAGQLVVARLPGQHLLVADPLGDVGVGDDDPPRPLDPRRLQPEPARERPELGRVLVVEGAGRTVDGLGLQAGQPGGDLGVVARPETARHRRQVVVADAAGLGSPLLRSSSPSATHARLAVRIRPSSSTRTVAEGSASRTAVS